MKSGILCRLTKAWPMPRTPVPGISAFPKLSMISFPDNDMNLTDAHEIRNAVNSGKVSAREVAEAALARIQAIDKKLGVFLTSDPARVLARADEIDRSVRTHLSRSPVFRLPSRTISAHFTCERPAARKFWRTTFLHTARLPLNASSAPARS